MEEKLHFTVEQYWRENTKVAQKTKTKAELLSVIKKTVELT